MLGVLVLALWRPVVEPVVGNPLIGEQPVNVLMQALISLIVLGSALYIVLSKKYKSDTEKWAFAIIGVVVGFWLQ
jgi:hypothetical protein